MSGVIIEWAPFRVVEGVSEQQLLLASRDLQEAFLDGRPGFVRRELLRGSEGRWVDLVYWEDERSARAAQEAASASSAESDAWVRSRS